MKKKYVVLILVLAVVLLAGTISWVVWTNTHVKMTTVTVRESNLPLSFDGFKIAQVSDLHNSPLWEQTIELLREAEPNMIMITGDLVDSRNPDIDTAIAFIQEAAQIADCFYITGNHEARLPEEDYNRLISVMDQYGVSVLDNREVKAHRGGQYISLVGHSWGSTENIGDLSTFDGYTILLTHQPEGFVDYVSGGYDLVLTGHVHGGQIRLPLIGGLYAPGQGLFPKYDSGMYTRGDTDMYVSRGIGNSSFPIRFNNQPEVVLFILERA